VKIQRASSPGTGEREAITPRLSIFKVHKKEKSMFKTEEKSFLTIRFTLTHFSLRQNSPLKNELDYNLEKPSHVVFVINFLPIEIT
jgi:hypothetical protein